MSALTNITRQEVTLLVGQAISNYGGLQKASAVDYAVGDPEGQYVKVYDITDESAFDATALTGKTVIVVEVDNAKLNALDEKAIGKRVSDGNLPS